MADDTLDFLKGFQLDDYDMDLGITFVDEQPSDSTSSATAEVVENISTQVEGLGELGTQVNQIQSTLSGIKALLDFDELNIEGKLDQILIKIDEVPTHTHSDDSVATADISSETLGKIDQIIDIMGDPVARKAEIERRLQESIEAQKDIVDGKLTELEKLVLPLLVNLIKPESLEQKYIYWPNRKEIVERQIKKILLLTRGE